MSSGDPDLNLLIALRALLEEANVTRAGERIGMGQSTMSSALARLRTQFDDELLVRVGREYELTPLARQLLPQVQVTLPLIEQVLSSESIFNRHTSTRMFRVQSTDYSAVELRPIFARTALAAPGICLEMLPLAPDPAASDYPLLSHDFMVAPPGIGIEGEGFELFRDDYVVIADRNNPAVADGVISLDDFVRLSHVRCDFGPGQLTTAERTIRELDLALDVRVETSSLLPIPLIVAGTDLISVVPSRLFHQLDGVNATVIVPTPFPTATLIERLWWHPAHNHDAAHAWFRRRVQELVESGALALETGR